MIAMRCEFSGDALESGTILNFLQKYVGIIKNVKDQVHKIKKERKQGLD